MSTGDSAWLVYEVDGRAYRTPASAVQTIEPFEAGEPLPFEGPFAGALALHGELVAVMRLAEAGRPTRLVVVRTRDGLLGLASDVVRGIEPLEDCEGATVLDEAALLARVARSLSSRTA